MDDYFAGTGRPQHTGSGPAAPLPTMAYQPPPGWPVAPHPAWPHQPPPPGMSTGIKILLGVAIGFVGLIVIGILAAIAIPVFLNQRAKAVAAHTTVNIPAMAAGLALRTDAASLRMVQPLKDLPLPGEHLAGAYGGTARPEALVSITRGFMSPTDQRGYLAGSVRSAQRASTDGAQFGSVDPGSLGGAVQCSSAPTTTVCFFVDAGVYGSVVVFGSPDRGLQLMSELRAAVEHRT